MSRMKSAWLSMGLGIVLVSVILLASIFKSTSSTAGLGLLVLPFQIALFAPFFFVFGYCLPDLLVCLKQRSTDVSISVKRRAVTAFVMAVCALSYLVYGVTLTVAVNKISSANEHRLSEFMDFSIFRNNKFALAALAQNKNTTPEILDKLARSQANFLNDKIWSVWPVMLENGKGFSVTRLLIRNENVSASTIEYLASVNQDEYALSDIAMNAKTSPETLRQLETKKNYLIDWGLARNLNTPPAVFNKLLERDKYFTQDTTLKMLLKNPSVSLEVRAKAAELLNAY